MVLIINGEVECTGSISSLLHIYRKQCTENVSLLVKTKEPYFFLLLFEFKFNQSEPTSIML